VDISKLEAEKAFSPAALRVIRRHRPDPEDARNCRGCGRPMAACDVLVLAALIVDNLRLAKPEAAVEPGLSGSTTVAPRAKFPAQAPRRRVKRTPISA